MKPSISMQKGCVYQMEDGKKFLLQHEVGGVLGGTCLETGKNRYLKSSTRAVKMVEDRRVRMTKHYRTRSGIPVKIQETDILGDYCILASIPTKGKWRMWTFLVDGRHKPDLETDIDLIEYTPVTYQYGDVVGIWRPDLTWGVGSVTGKVAGYSDRYQVAVLDEAELVKGNLPPPRNVTTVEMPSHLMTKLSEERVEYLMSGLQARLRRATR